MEAAGEVAWALHAGVLILHYRAAGETAWHVTAWVPLRISCTRRLEDWAALGSTGFTQISYTEAGARAAGSCLLTSVGAVRDTLAVA